MRIIRDRCTDCGHCLFYCPVEAIFLREGTVVINDERCVECGVCLRSDICPEDALFANPLSWPRTLRSAFSDLKSPYSVPSPSGRGGRGVKEELKTNDVVGRIRGDLARISIEVGRPRGGASFREVEKVTTALAGIGCVFESDFPTTLLMSDTSCGRLRKDILDEVVLYAPVSCTLSFDRLGSLLDEMERLSGEIDALFVGSVILRMSEQGFPPSLGQHEDLVKAMLSKNGKVNVGLGRASGEASSR
ncbi:MAG: DUF362 domain-containing protein [bacterium]